MEIYTESYIAKNERKVMESVINASALRCYILYVLIMSVFVIISSGMLPNLDLLSNGMKYFQFANDT